MGKRQTKEHKALIKTLMKKIHAGEMAHFRELFLDLHTYEQATFFLQQGEETRLKIYAYLTPDELAGIFENFEVDDQQVFISEMTPEYAAQMLSNMYTDDAVDVLNGLTTGQVASYLTIMDDEAADAIKELLHYEEKTAGSIMTTEYVSIRSHVTIRESMQLLKKEAPEAETIYYIYVLDERDKLCGVISLRDLIIAPDDDVIKDHMNGRVVSVSVGEDQEEVAKTIMDYDFLAVPVVDFQNHLLGIITIDDMMDVLNEEATDDYSKLAGISDVKRTDRNPVIAAKKRLPWLIILLFLGMMTASIIGQFEATLNQVAILAVFIPLIAGMAGNTGTQALAVVVRGISNGDYVYENKWKLIVREASTGLITGSVNGVLVAIMIYLWQHQIFLGILVGFSLLCTLVVATLAGALVPLLMNKLNIDPAVASGPFITTINDIISILIYFGMATAFMNYLL